MAYSDTPCTEYVDGRGRKLWAYWFPDLWPMWVAAGTRRDAGGRLLVDTEAHRLAVHLYAAGRALASIVGPHETELILRGVMTRKGWTVESESTSAIATEVDE